MRGKGRWRRVAVKWCLLAAAIGVLAMAVVNARWPFIWDWKDANALETGRGIEWVVHLSRGAIRVARLPNPRDVELDIEPGVTFFEPLPVADMMERWTWLPRGKGGRHDLPPAGYYGRFVLPLWIPFLLTFGPFLYLWHTDRKAARLARAGACVSCGYNRVGLAAGAACPECGALPKGAAAGGGKG